MKNATTAAISLLLITSSAMAQEITQPNQINSFAGEKTKSTYALLGEAPWPNEQIAQNLERNVDNGKVRQMATTNFVEEAGFVVYPNPSNGKFKVAIPQEVDVLSISVFTIHGKLISTQAGDSLNAPQEKDYDLCGEGPGGYIIFITTSDGVLTQRLIVQ